MSLPSDLISPFARVAALLNLKCSPRYQINHVFSSRSSQDAIVTAAAGSRQRASAAAGGHASGTSTMAMTMTPLGTGFGEHPQLLNQAVFHIGGCRKKHSVMDSAVEVVTTCLTFLTQLRPLLPPLSLRLSHPSLLNAILEIAAWDVAEEVGHDRERLLRFWSSSSDADAAADLDISTLSTELNIPLVMAKRLQVSSLPFLSPLTTNPLIQPPLTTHSTSNSLSCNPLSCNFSAILPLYFATSESCQQCCRCSRWQ